MHAEEGHVLSGLRCACKGWACSVTLTDAQEWSQQCIQCSARAAALVPIVSQWMELALALLVGLTMALQRSIIGCCCQQCWTSFRCISVGFLGKDPMQDTHAVGF
eukprot:1158548-Pelagomonas_calceolata.AAC.1